MIRIERQVVEGKPFPSVGEFHVHVGQKQLSGPPSLGLTPFSDPKF
jgi:hypothetical protein